MLTVGSLFSGIGGLDLGLERAGMQVKWQVEIDDYCNKVLEKHWPDVTRYRDVRTVGDGLEHVDLICGGFPCQPVSVAGKRKGKDDERWLWPEYIRIVRQVKPRWVVVENVPGLLSMDNGRLFAGILRDLSESGYDASWDCIPAAAFGAPHLRYRLFLVAYSQGSRSHQGHWKANERPSGENTKSRLGLGHSGLRQSDYTPQTMADANGKGQSVFQGCPTHEGLGRNGAISSSDWWDIEPDVDRVANGVPSRVDRLKGLGNAVVPQVAEWIGRRIMELEGG